MLPETDGSVAWAFKLVSTQLHGRLKNFYIKFNACGVSRAIKQNQVTNPGNLLRLYPCIIGPGVGRFNGCASVLLHRVSPCFNTT